MDVEEQGTGLTCAPTLKTRFPEGAGARIHNTTTTAKRSANSAAETTSRETRSATQDTRYRAWSGDVDGSDGIFPLGIRFPQGSDINETVKLVKPDIKESDLEQATITLTKLQNEWVSGTCDRISPCSKKSTAPDIKIVPRTTLMSYPEIDCPLKEVLELMQLSADEVTCREVLDTVVEQVSKAAEKDTLENLLKQMSHRPVYHLLNVMEDGTTQQRDFLVEMKSDHREKYQEKMASGEEASHQQYQSTPDSDKKG
ncbi:hypothetical protein HPB49_014807 [Dermacentor silvarum]|uniref:Uncharacterized protein n=1 Tax=Dermacentor silvarum TaxID=543639 RepID=A0ACB8DJE2_DERSI|nr:hypothetical protein HPB49_014807 [Dermacentor silvarum]